jgi:hypothetical protein
MSSPDSGLDGYDVYGGRILEDEHKVQLGISGYRDRVLDGPALPPPQLGAPVPPYQPWPGSNGNVAEKAQILARLKQYELTVTMPKTVKAKAMKNGTWYSSTINPVWKMKIAVKDGITAPAITDKSYKVVPEPEAAQ